MRKRARNRARWSNGYDLVCPFCGNEETPVLVVDETTSEEVARAHCADCDASGPLVHHFKTSPRMDVEYLEREAFEKWCERA